MYVCMSVVIAFVRCARTRISLCAPHVWLLPLLSLSHIPLRNISGYIMDKKGEQT